MFRLDIQREMMKVRCMYSCSVLSVRCLIPRSISHVQLPVQHYSDISVSAECDDGNIAVQCNTDQSHPQTIMEDPAL